MWKYRVDKVVWIYLPALLVCVLLSNVLACGGSTSSPGEASNDLSFSLELSPSTLALARGNQSYSTLITTAVGGFNSSITPAVSGVPNGVTVTFDPETIPASGSSNMTVAVGSRTATGTYKVEVSGVGGGIERNAILTLIIAGEVLLTWDASPSSGVVGYNVGRSTASGSGYARLNSGLIPGTSYTDQTAQSAHTYYYVVRAVNAAGQESVSSNEAVADVP